MSNLRMTRRVVLTLGLMAFFCGLSAAPALAGPELGLQITRAVSPLHHGDERLVYQLTVENKAAAQPSPGDQLTCKGTPEEGLPWTASPAPSFEIEWLRDTIPISGSKGPAATAKTYTVSTEDSGKSLQCLVTATNDADGAGGSFSPNSTLAVSVPPVVVAPAPSPAPATGTSRPGLSGPAGAAASGTATITSGSASLTNVVTAEGSGTITAGSAVIKEVATTNGVFIAESLKQEIRGVGIPADTEIVRVLSATELEISNAATGSGAGVALSAGALPFQQGQKVVGVGIPPGAEIVNGANGGQTLILSANATVSGVKVPVAGISEETCNVPLGWSAGAPINWNFQWVRNGVPIPGATNSVYVVQGADTKPPSVFQCEATAEVGGSRSMSISAPEFSRPNPPDPYQAPLPNGTVSAQFANQSAGLVGVTAELPGGSETYAFKAVGAGWSCSKKAPTAAIHASVECARADSLAPEDTFPAIEVVTALGKNPPDTLIAKASVSGGGAPNVATAEDEFTIPEPALPFGFKVFTAEALDTFGGDYTQAGGHPASVGASLEFNTHVRAEEASGGGEGESLIGSPRIIETRVPRGFIGNPQATPVRCPTITDVLTVPSTCPPSSVVGGLDIRSGKVGQFHNAPIYAMESEYGVLPQFVFGLAGSFAYTLTPSLRADEGYAISLITAPIAKNTEPFSASVKLCGFGVKLGSLPTGEFTFKGCKAPNEPGANEVPLFTNPTRCAGGPPVTRILADTWEEPGRFAEAKFTNPPMTGCDQVQFEPNINLTPTSNRADSPTGLDVKLTMPTEGLTEAEGVGQANLEGAKVTFPLGMALNPSIASGLGACTQAELGMTSGVPDNDPAHCPESARIGTVEAETPILEKPLQGSLFVAKQGDNPFRTLLAVYLVLESKELGLTIKLAGRVSPDPVTGQLTTSFDENPEAPLSRVELHFASGNRAPLINPPGCGTYKISSQLTPWTAADPNNPAPAELVSSTSSFKITRGPGGGACPSNQLEPKFSAGLANPTAGTSSSFSLQLRREDGTQRFTGLEVSTPRGLSAYLKSIPYCPDPTLAGIPSAEGTGAGELASPACPASSQIGTVSVGAGAGPNPFYVDSGKVYLAGPYKGAPLSLAIVTPAVAGPFDLGNVVVRAALRVDPETTQVTTVSDPIPTIVHGILLDVRDVRTSLNRPNFILAPTNCEPTSVNARVGGQGGGSAVVSDRFQVGGCETLKFKPNLKIRLHGGTKRGSFQRLVANVTYPPGSGYANIASAAVTLPHSSFLAQEHIRTICTRVQFAANQCPVGSIYGEAKATSPIVDYPLEGPVYLRSSSNPLPDLVMALRGPERQPIEVDLVGRVDSKGGGIRVSFDAVPDAPVSKFTLEMKGGKKSLTVNSRNLCKGKQRATVLFSAQNGIVRNFRPIVKNDCHKGNAKGRGGRP